MKTTIFAQVMHLKSILTTAVLTTLASSAIASGSCIGTYHPQSVEGRIILELDRQGSRNLPGRIYTQNLISLLRSTHGELTPQKMVTVVEGLRKKNFVEVYDGSNGHSGKYLQLSPIILQCFENLTTARDSNFNYPPNFDRRPSPGFF